jgi:hypothetical protein
LISRFLTTDDICHALLPAYPHLFEELKNNVPTSVVSAYTPMEHIREVMLASPRKVKDMTLACRPQKDSHLNKLRTLLKSPSLVTLTVIDLTWLVGERISTELSELRFEVEFKDVHMDIWSTWFPASPVPNQITSLSVRACNDPLRFPEEDDPQVLPSYLCDRSSCFQVFQQLEKIHFWPPPGDAFWASASDLALSRVREMELQECQHDDYGVDDLCSCHFVKHAARFTNLVQLKLVDACDILDRLVELNVVLPSLEVYKAERCTIRDHEKWMRMPTVFPSLYHLEVTNPFGHGWNEALFKEILPRGFANLRVIKLCDARLSLETCVAMAEELLEHRPIGHVSIWCSGLTGEVSDTTAALLESLRVLPSCTVSTEEVVTRYSRQWGFRLDR